MKKFMSYGKGFRSLVLIAFAVIMLVAGGLAVGNGGNTVLQESSAVEPGWYCYFGTANTVQPFSGNNDVTVSKKQVNYFTFKTNDTNGVNFDPSFYPCITQYNLASGGPSGNIKTNTCKYGIMRYRISSAIPNASVQLLFETNAGAVTGQAGRYSSSMRFFQNDNNWHDLPMDMSSYSGWAETIKSLRVDFDGIPAGNTIDIAFIAFFKNASDAETWAKGTITIPDSSPAVNAPTTNDYASVNTSKMTGNIKVSGGSTTDTDYEGASTMMRFYRSNLNQYLTFDGEVASMEFEYENVSKPYEIDLNNGTKGIAVAKIAVYYANSDAASGNNADGAIQWTYVSETSGTVDFRDPSFSSIALGSYYDQDLCQLPGYLKKDEAVEKGDDKYQYSGAFARQVLPPGTYEAKIEYDVLFDHYVVVNTSELTYDYLDGPNLRKYPGSGELRTLNGTVVTNNDTDGLITTVPFNEKFDIYVGFDTTDTTTASCIKENEKCVFSLYGGVFYPQSNATNPEIYSKDRVWRMVRFEYEGVLYEGWLDTHFTNFDDLVKDKVEGGVVSKDWSVNPDVVKDTKLATGKELNLIPRKYKRTDGGKYAYGQWSPYTYPAGTSEAFAVRWSWSFNTEQNVKDFTKSNTTAETPNYYYTGAQVEYNTNGYVTLTSTSTSTSSDSRALRMSHVFTKSQTYDDYDADKKAGWATGNAIASASTGLCRVDWDDPVNSSNANNGEKTAYVAVVYRTQDTVATTNTMNIYFAVGGPKDDVTGGTSSANITCDGTWRTVVVDISTNGAWMRTEDNLPYDGKRGTDLSYMHITPFSSGTIIGGKSIDIAMVGIFTTQQEAMNYGQKYIDKNLATQRGSVRVISGGNGTVTLTMSDDSSTGNNLENVAEGSTFKVNVTPDAGYYCSKLCWRPTGYILNDMIGQTKEDGTKYFSADQISYYTATNADTEYVNVLDSNVINNNLFGTNNADKNKASCWQNDTWGNTPIMTLAQIKAYNAKLVQLCTADSRASRNDQVVDILDKAKKDNLTKATIQAYIDAMVSEEKATGQAEGQWNLDAAYANRNYDASKFDVKFGVVTTRANIRALPTDSKSSTTGNDMIQETGLAYGTPVWVLHMSTDEKFYFVQSYNYRGWVDASAIATTDSYGEWIEFANPEIRGDIVVTNAIKTTIDGQDAEMGCVFQYVSGPSNSQYTIKVPVRKDDGTLSSKNATVATADSSIGYLDYTWNEYVNQLFKYINTPYSWGDAEAGRVDCSSFAATVLKTFGFKYMRNASQQATDIGYTSIMNNITYSYSGSYNMDGSADDAHSDNNNRTFVKVGYYDLAKFSGTPIILSSEEGTDHTMIYLGMINGVHYAIEAPSTGLNVRVIELLDTNDTSKHNRLSRYSYAIMAPNNYLEDAPLRNSTVSGSTIKVKLKTPAYGEASSTLNGGLDADRLLDAGKTGADPFILNSGGRDIYVWAEFSPITYEVAVDVQLQIPDGFGIAEDVDFGAVNVYVGNANISFERASFATVCESTNPESTIRLLVFKGYKLKEIKVSDNSLITRSDNISPDASDNNGTVLSGSGSYNYYKHPASSITTATVSSGSGPQYVSYNQTESLTSSGDGSITFIIEPTSYEVVYNSNYPSDLGAATTTVTGKHYYNCLGNDINGTATFQKGTGVKYDKSYTFNAGSDYKFMGWSTSGGTANMPKYNPKEDYSHQNEVFTLFDEGKQGEKYPLYAVWAPINYTLSVEFVSQVDRELIGTPNGFYVKVGANDPIKKNDNATVASKKISLATLGSVKTNCSANYANGILSITTQNTGDSYYSVDNLDVDVLANKYMAITYKLSGGASTNNYMTFLTGATGSSYANSTDEYSKNCVRPGWIADGKWHTAVFNMADMTTFYYNNKTLKGIQIPGSTVQGGVLDIKSISFYSTPPTLWGDSKETESPGGDATALKTQGSYTFNHVLNASTSVNVVSAQQADYDFVMDLKEAYLFFYDADRNIVTNSTWDAKFDGNKNITVNGVTQKGYDVSGLIQNHTFDMSSLKFEMPGYHVKLVFVCDYMHYSVKVFTYTTGTSNENIPNVSLSNSDDTFVNDGRTSVNKSFSEGSITLSVSKNDGIWGRYGSTVELTVSNIAGGKQFLGWYELLKDSDGNPYLGKLLSASTPFTLSENLHKDMEIVAVFGAKTEANTVFNFRNVAGQVIQTLVATKDSYIDVTNITAKPFKACSVFSGWAFLKHVDKSGATKITHTDGKVYYLVDGTSKYGYSVLYSDPNCTDPAYIFANGTGGTVDIDGSYTTLTTGKVQITVQGDGTINGGSEADVAYNTTVTAVATGTSTFKGWIDVTVKSTRFTDEAYKGSDGFYYPYISYSETFKFKAIKAMTIQPIYVSATEADKKPNVSITPVVQKVAATSGSTNYYKYTAYGMFTADPGDTYQILEWGALFYVGENASDKPTTISYDPMKGEMKTEYILTTDSYVEGKFAKVANSYSNDANLSGQYGASIGVTSAKTIYVRMYCRYSYMDTTTGETVYVVTYSDTYTFASSAYSSSISNGYITGDYLNLYATVDLKPSDFDGGLF